ncbi:MAG TPA: MBL fold metallo-hydrolase [Caldilineaceae bacterium]|nr:MBL fold metallo-hydrolase [Caldilineaceae bacterium]
MIHVEQQGNVLAVRMSRSFFGRPFWWTTAYWVDGLLIDTGPRFAAKDLCRALQKLTVDQIVITHAHENQIGGLPTLLERYPAAKVYVSRRSLPFLQDPPNASLQFYRRILWGTPQPWLGPVTILDEIGDCITTPTYGFRVIETPGHTPDHIALFEPTQRWLFSGDTYLHGQDDAWSADADLFGVICSLRTLASLHPERLFAADGRISRTPLPELHGKIGLLVQYARDVARMDALGLTSEEMALRLFPKDPPITFWTRGHYSARHLIGACRSYNALFMTMANERVQPQPPARQVPEEEEDPTDSSSNWPIDWEDLLG